MKFMHKYTDGLNIERFAAGWQGMALMEPLEVFCILMCNPRTRGRPRELVDLGVGEV